MYHLTKLEELNIAASHWYNETLKFDNYKDGLAGFKAWRPDHEGGPKSEYGLLEGVSGIGLSLLSAVAETPLNWDECLLLP